jgi:hypothetical protein
MRFHGAQRLYPSDLPRSTTVNEVIWHVTMSLDGFITGPDDSMDWAVGEWSDDCTPPERSSAAGAGTTSLSGCAESGQITDLRFSVLG